MHACVDVLAFCMRVFWITGFFSGGWGGMCACTHVCVGGCGVYIRVHGNGVGTGVGREVEGSVLRGGGRV